MGIGASAGGLAAFEEFFSAMPTDTESGLAFILVQHLAPDHKSILSDLVKRYTSMQVFEVEDGMKVEPNCAYIIPPNRDMALLRGVLRLFEPVAPRGQRLPIDFFFRSLAQDQRERAICIVLSGTGGDGTLGLRAIKGEGGMAMAQSPDSTEYDGMPRNAIATGLVDYVLRPAKMPAQLIAYAARASRGARRSAEAAAPKSEDDLARIFVLLRAQTGHDFSAYKQTTIARRVERRMAIHQIERMDGYVRYLQETPAEVEVLFRELLIGVTSFFRDPEAFEVLESQVIPRLFVNKPADSPIRVWVPGCSTGEEAYSIAILLRERLDAIEQSFTVQVFATDIDARAIEAARGGAFPASIAADMTKDRLERHFSPVDANAYRINKGVRDLLIFSEQDVARDPPFSRLDLISCRNLMIYMGAELQKRLILLFHYALNPAGTLFLGSSETVGDFGNLFSIIDRKAKLYQRREDLTGAARPHSWQSYTSNAAGGAPASPARVAPRVDRLPLRELTERTLLANAPDAALTNERGEILYLHGHTGLYLEPAPGEMGVNILKMAREGLRQDLTAALFKASFEREPVFRPGLRVKTNGSYTDVDLVVRPVSFGTGDPNDPRLFLVVFERGWSEEQEKPPPGKTPSPTLAEETSPRPSTEDSRIAALEQQLRTKDEYLHATREEMQTANEELQSSNEELQSTNEELQSTNEELETSKEELQSVNEELTTVNAELVAKVADLSRVSNDMNNLLASTGIGTIFVDHQLRIQRFTPTAAELVNLIQADVGRPLKHIASNFVGYDRLVADVKAVLDDLTPREIEVRTGTGDTYLLRIRAYRTFENVIEGAVITFTCVTALKNAEAATRASDALRAQAGALQDARDAIIVQDLEGRILAFNPGAVRMYGWSESEALTMNIRALIPEAGRRDALAVVERLSRAEVLEPYRTERLCKDGRRIEVTLTATALVNAAGTVYGITTVERGIST